jgi:hypothetical protein
MARKEERGSRRAGERETHPGSGQRAAGSQKPEAAPDPDVRVAASRVMCPLCNMPMTAYSTRAEYTYYKCGGMPMAEEMKPGCGHTMSVRRQKVG